MSYTKHNFQSGDTLYASQLNAMEDQIAANEAAAGDIGAISDALAELGVNVDTLQAATYRENRGRKRIVDALEAKIRDLNIYGHSDQAPDPGSEYQLIPWTPGYTATGRGVTVTVGQDQRLSVVGTATSTGAVQCCNIPFAVEAQADYTAISNNPAVGYTCVSGSQWITLVANSGNQLYRRMNFQANSVSGVYLYVSEGTSYNLTGIEFMLCKGRLNAPDLPAWEPFVSPGPLYPSPEAPLPPRATTRFTIQAADRTGQLRHEVTITPPRPLYGLGDYGDCCDPERGVWKYYVKKLRVTGDMIAWPTGSFAQTDAYAIRNLTTGRVDADQDGNGGNSPAYWDMFQKEAAFWTTDTPYTAIDGKTSIQFKLPKGTDPAAWFTEHETYVWVAADTPEEVTMDAGTQRALKALKTYNVQTVYTVTDQNGNDLTTRFLYQLNLSAMFGSGAVEYDFTPLHLACDGDSTTYEGADGSGLSWPYYLNRKLNFASKTNVAMGNALACDRSSDTSGTAYTCQWKPTAGDGWVDYYGLSDPNFAGGASVYASGTAEYDQAVANNCLYSHIGYFIDGVARERFPKPDVFILAMQGINDLWGADAAAAESIIGTVEAALTGSWESLTRDTVLKAIRWAIQRLRQEYPACRLFFKTAAQKTSASHPGYALLEDRVLALCRALSVPVIDSFGELGVQTEFESSAGAYRWTSDGVHPTQAGYEKDGAFTAARLRGYFI